MERMLSRFFSKELLPIAKTMRAKGKSLLLIDRDETIDSYFVSVRKSDKLRGGMVEGSMPYREVINKGLSKVFSVSGREYLLPTIKTTLNLAIRLRKVRKIKKVSDFIYEMY